MNLTGEQSLPLARERVWTALMDPETLKAAIPGCESVVDQGDGSYKAVVVAAIGPVRARFSGKLKFQDVQAPTRYTLDFEGDGGVAGFAKGSAEVELAEVSDQSTNLTYKAQARIGGRLAQIGSRLIDATAARMTAQFFDRLTQRLTAPVAPRDAAQSDAQAQAEPVVARAVPEAADKVRAGNGRAMVSVQMPAWTWAFTVMVIALLAAYLATR